MKHLSKAMASTNNIVCSPECYPALREPREGFVWPFSQHVFFWKHQKTCVASIAVGGSLDFSFLGITEDSQGIDAQQLHWRRIRMNTRRPKDHVLTYVIKDYLQKQ
ncbi:hypothetical protein MRX96_049907 [Rhipicephalus microplus]